MNPLTELPSTGQSPWLDAISRELISSGGLERLIREEGLRGVTSNPAIFAASIARGAGYDAPLRRRLETGERDRERLYEGLAFADIRDAADALRRVYEATDRLDGFVSLEVSPLLAFDREATVAAGRRLFAEVGRPNVMIKVPATAPCLGAITRLIADGIPVNATLIFCVDRYEAVAQAYIEGLEALDAAGGRLSEAASVASFFVSRIDAAVDRELEARIASGEDLKPLLGKAAVAQAKAAYRAFLKAFASPRFLALKSRGARVQRPLWASTGTKNPGYSDVLYVQELIGPDTVNTMPEATWKAFLDHGRPLAALEDGWGEAEKTLAALKTAGVDMGRITRDLEAAGVEAFASSFRGLLDEVARKAAEILKPSAPAARAASTLAGLRAAERLWAVDSSLWKEAPAHRKVIDNSLGWLRMPEEMEPRAQGLAQWASETRYAGIERALLLGMGGSSLAPEVFRRSFGTRTGFVELSVLDSTDPEAVLAADRENDPARTLYIVSSKSGTTTEPLRLLDYFWSRARRGLKDGAGRHFAAITDPGSFLEGQARERGFREVFLNPPDIGGRFSALSLFGLVPAALIGVDTAELLLRARRMAQACRLEGDSNPGLSLASELAAHAEAGRDKLSLLISPRIAGLGLWLEQLIAESTGKEGRGLLPIAEEPPCPESLYGRDRVFVHIRVDSLPDEVLERKAASLQEAGHPVVRLALGDPMDLGAEMFRWEVATAALGRLLGINPFDQPDVQSAKDRTKAVLDSGRLPLVSAHGSQDGLSLSFSRAALPCAGAGLDASLGRFLSLAKPGEYLGLLPFVSPRGEYDPELKSLASALLRSTGRAVQPGYGPRYLHSTGQLHKGGPDNGLFLVLYREDAPALPIEGCPYGFETLVNAQAIGDFQALDSAGRRAALVRFRGDPRQAFRRLEAAAIARA